MRQLRYTLLSDGSSDRTLLPVLRWLLEEHCTGCTVDAQFVDTREMPNPPRNLPDRIREAVKRYPCELLFINRDSEKEPPAHRADEINWAVAEAAATVAIPPVVRVIPIRMHEAWLMFDERAIRYAANNPNGNQRLSLPPLKKIESLPDPKEKLYGLLKKASGLTGRRLDRFQPNVQAYQITESIKDFSPLRNLSAFATLEKELQAVIHE
jgi:hypothetical protein